MPAGGVLLIVLKALIAETELGQVWQFGHNHCLTCILAGRYLPQCADGRPFEPILSETEAKPAAIFAALGFPQ